MKDREDRRSKYCQKCGGETKDFHIITLRQYVEIKTCEPCFRKILLEHDQL